MEIQSFTVIKAELILSYSVDRRAPLNLVESFENNKTTLFFRQGVLLFMMCLG